MKICQHCWKMFSNACPKTYIYSTRKMSSIKKSIFEMISWSQMKFVIGSCVGFKHVATRYYTNNSSIMRTVTASSNSIVQRAHTLHMSRTFLQLLFTKCVDVLVSSAFIVVFLRSNRNCTLFFWLLLCFISFFNSKSCVFFTFWQWICFVDFGKAFACMVTLTQKPLT